MQSFFTYSFYILLVVEFVMLVIWAIRFKYVHASDVMIWGIFWVLDWALAVEQMAAQQSLKWPQVPELFINILKVIEFAIVLWLFKIHLNLSKNWLIAVSLIFGVLWSYEFYKSFTYVDGGLNESWLASCFMILVALFFSFRYIRQQYSENTYFVSIPFFWICVSMIINYTMALPAQIPSPITGDEKYAMIFYATFTVVNVIALILNGYAFWISKNWYERQQSKLKY